MIKDLIADIAYDRILLSQALTRAKLIANKIKNQTFKRWLSMELEGYDLRSNALPEYRVLACDIFITIDLPHGKTHTFPLAIGEADQAIKDAYGSQNLPAPVSIIEKTLEGLTTLDCRIPIPNDDLVNFERMIGDEIAVYHGKVCGGYFQVWKSQYQYIVEMTKQRLLDTLMELDNQFPNLENEFMATKDNSDIVNNIITNYIYGEGNFVDVAAGQSVNQSNSKNNGTTNTQP